MKILDTREIKLELNKKLKKYDFKDKILLLSYQATAEEKSYKNYIIRRCQEYGIDYIDHEFEENTSAASMIDYINKFDRKDGFIVFLPFGTFNDLDYLREKIKLKDLDGFNYESMGKALNGNYNYLPATSKAIAKFLLKNYNIKSKNIVIANNTNLIGLPLATYLSKNFATVTVINEKTKNDKDLIKSSDIFITAIGKANYYDKSYFKDGQILIDVGTSYVNGKIVGDINFDDLEELDLEILTSKDGIGAITTLALLERLID